MGFNLGRREVASGSLGKVIGGDSMTGKRGRREVTDWNQMRKGDRNLKNGTQTRYDEGKRRDFWRNKLIRMTKKGHRKVCVCVYEWGKEKRL